MLTSMLIFFESWSQNEQYIDPRQGGWWRKGPTKMKAAFFHRSDRIDIYQFIPKVLLSGLIVPDCLSTKRDRYRFCLRFLLTSIKAGAPAQCVCLNSYCQILDMVTHFLLTKDIQLMIGGQLGNEIPFIDAADHFSISRRPDISSPEFSVGWHQPGHNSSYRLRLFSTKAMFGPLEGKSFQKAFFQVFAERDRYFMQSQEAHKNTSLENIQGTHCES